jgi:pimeloyl-ACP methyl ester carboxylesterase
MLAAISAAGQTPAPLGKLVDIGGHRVHLYCTGSGSPTVMVVGAGFSFDWALVQPEVARFTTICTYDVSGAAWSEPAAGARMSCRDRVTEVHKLMAAARLATPVVLVGLSLGGCVARLYAAEFPVEVAGMVIVDHAFSPDPPHAASGERSTTAPVVIYQAPIVVTAEDISNFKQLPESVQQFHRWAVSLKPVLPSWEDAEECLAQVKSAGYPLDNRPLVVVSTNNQARGYARLQAELLRLSRSSTQMIADRSFHAVEIDQPEVVVAAIRRVVESVRR